jgi:hypothetical protein
LRGAGETGSRGAGWAGRAGGAGGVGEREAWGRASGTLLKRGTKNTRRPIADGYKQKSAKRSIPVKLPL